MSAKFKLMVRLTVGSGLGILLAGTLLSGCKKEPQRSFFEEAESNTVNRPHASTAPRNAFSQPSNTDRSEGHYAKGIKTIILPDLE